MLMARQQRLQGLIVGSRRHHLDLIRGIGAVHDHPVIDRSFPLVEIATHAVYGAGHVSTAEEVEAIKAAWRVRLAEPFNGTPVPFQSQNSGDFPDRHTMADHVAPGQTGLGAHVADLIGA